MKECHPDKFQGDENRIAVAEESKQVIEAHHFLSKYQPETTKLNLPEYCETNATITDYKFVEW
jgi:hypothetical protein